MEPLTSTHPMFTREDILNELLVSGGRMLNSQLVLRFARYLKNPATKEEAKAKFKDYVNKLATLVTDPQTGEKFVVLRPEVRDQIRRNNVLAPSHSIPPPPVPQAMTPSPQVMAAVAAHPPMPRAPPPTHSQQQHHQHHPPHNHHHQQQQQQLHQQPQSQPSHRGYAPSQPQPPSRSGRQPPAYQQAVSSSKLNKPAQSSTAQTPFSQGGHPFKSRPSSLKLVHDNDTPDGILTHQRRSSAGTINTQLLQQSGMVIPKSINTPPPPPLRSLSKSVPSLLSEEADLPPVVPSRSRRHSTKGTVVEEKVKQFAEKEFVKDETRLPLSDKTSVAVSPGTVKEKVQMLKMTSEGNLTAPQPQQMPAKATQVKDTHPRRVLSSRNSNHDSDDKCSVSTLDPLRREFCRKAMACDYQAMQKMLQEDPSLAKSIDYVLGYNALHWAAKFGQSDVIKLIAGTYNVDPNIKTRGSGQTPLHIANMFNQNAIIDLLVLTYGAQKDVRDFSGRKPEFYLNQKKSRSKIHHADRDEKDEDNTFAKPEPKPFAKRYGSFNVNIKKTLHHLNLKNWEGLGGVDEESHSLPPLSRGSRKLPKRAKRTASLLSTVTGRSTLAPLPVTEEKQHDSDSDSAYGFNA